MYNIERQYQLHNQHCYGERKIYQSREQIIHHDHDWQDSAEEGWIDCGMDYIHQRDYINQNQVSSIPQEQLIADSVRYALGSTKILHTGTEFGSVHPNHPNYLNSLDETMSQMEVRNLLLPRLFGIQLTEVNDLNQEDLEQTRYNIFRTKEKSDAVFMTKEFAKKNNLGIGYMTAGTHVWSFEGTSHNGTEFIASSHAPISSLLDPNNYDNILNHIVAKFKEKGVNPKDILMHITTGALGCCLGWKTDNPEYQAKNQIKLDKMKELYGSDVVGTLTQGPRAGGNAIHLDKIAISAATQLGLRHIEVDSICTSCHGHQSLGTPDTHGTYLDGQHTVRATEIEQGFNNRNLVVTKAF